MTKQPASKEEMLDILREKGIPKDVVDAVADLDIPKHAKGMSIAVIEAAGKYMKDNELPTSMMSPILLTSFATLVAYDLDNGRPESKKDMTDVLPLLDAQKLTILNILSTCGWR